MQEFGRLYCCDLSLGAYNRLLKSSNAHQSLAWWGNVCYCAFWQTTSNKNNIISFSVDAHAGISAYKLNGDTPGQT